jgi:hypothetical protein
MSLVRRSGGGSEREQHFSGGPGRCRRLSMKRTPFLLLLVSLWLTPSAAAAPFEFYATVTAKDSIDESTTDLTVEITPQFELTVRVTPLTEIKDRSGWPVSIDSIEEGALIAVEAMHTVNGLLALEIRVQGTGHTFEIGGFLEDVDPEEPSIVVQGIPIAVRSATEIKDEANLPLTLDELASRLEEDGAVWVKVEGFALDGELVATEIKIQPSRLFARISLEGILDRFDNGGQFFLDIGGGIEVLVKLTDETVVRGDLVAGVYVKVKGYIDQDLAVVAVSVSVVGLFELSPDSLRIPFGETREVTVVLRRSLPSPLALAVESSDPAIAVVSDDAVVVPEGTLSAVFIVTAGHTEGRTEIVVRASEEFGSVSRRVRVTVGDPTGFGGPPHPLGLEWAPRVVRAVPQGWADVNLMLMFGAAPEDLEIPLELVDPSDDLEMEYPPSVIIPQGERFVRLRLLFHSRSGSGLLRAALDDSGREVTADLDIDLRPPAVPGIPGTPAPVPLGIAWTPPRVQVRAGTEFGATLRLTPRAPEDLEVVISVVGDAPATGSFPGIVSWPAGRQEARISFRAPEQPGTVRYRAALPRELGGRHADLEVVVF